MNVDATAIIRRCVHSTSLVVEWLDPAVSLTAPGSAGAHLTVSATGIASVNAHLVIVDSSFNPPTRAHQRLLVEAVREVQLEVQRELTKQGDHAAQPSAHPYVIPVCMLSTANVDKKIVVADGDSSDDEIITHEIARRLAMVQLFAAETSSVLGVQVRIALTNAARFIDKARVLCTDDAHGSSANTIEKHLWFALGYDTYVRLFDGKYYRRKVSNSTARNSGANGSTDNDGTSVTTHNNLSNDSTHDDWHSHDDTTEHHLITTNLDPLFACAQFIVAPRMINTITAAASNPIPPLIEQRYTPRIRFLDASRFPRDVQEVSSTRVRELLDGKNVMSNGGTATLDDLTLPSVAAYLRKTGGS